MEAQTHENFALLWSHMYVCMTAIRGVEWWVRNGKFNNAIIVCRAWIFINGDVIVLYIII